jgi:hypothetical protein
MTTDLPSIAGVTIKQGTLVPTVLDSWWDHPTGLLASGKRPKENFYNLPYYKKTKS